MSCTARASGAAWASPAVRAVPSTTATIIARDRPAAVGTNRFMTGAPHKLPVGPSPFYRTRPRPPLAAGPEITHQPAHTQARFSGSVWERPPLGGSIESHGRNSVRVIPARKCSPARGAGHLFGVGAGVGGARVRQ